MGKKRAENKNYPAFIGFWIKNETRIALGIIISGLSLYFSIIMLSFLFTGSSDFSKVDGIGFSDLNNVGKDIQNLGGAFGAWVSNIMINHWFGFSSLLMVVFVWFVGLKLLGVTRISIPRTFFLCLIGIIWFSLFFGFCFKPLYEDTFLRWGGDHGYFLSEWLTEKVGMTGTILIIAISLFIFLLFASQATSRYIGRIFHLKTSSEKESKMEDQMEIQEGEVSEDFEKSWTGKFGKKKKKDKKNIDENEVAGIPVPDEEPLAEPLLNKVPSDSDEDDDVDFSIKVGQGDEQYDDPEDNDAETDADPGNIPIPNKIVDVDDYDASDLGEYDPKLDLSSYKYPSLNLLTRYDNNDAVINKEEQNSNKRRIKEVLEQFGIKISSITATIGATVTLYEIIPEPGIRISRIKSLENDIALSLSALGIRIIAPIPGKGTIGIEVPNRDPQIVSMYSVLSSRKFQETKYELPLALGKTITNEICVLDLCKMPHILVAGATGQGKSVGLHAMISSLLYKKHPSELKFVMIDPKMVEFSIYGALEKHFLAKLPDDSNAIVTDFTKVVQTLNSLTREMDDRYNLLMAAKVRNIKEYNNKFISRRLNPEKGHKFLPYIVVVIDEFGDLIMTAGKEIEMPIARIAQKARAVGIHMIIATQRPTTNIITGTIKANFPARIAFHVFSVTDSRTILDASGANQLIGRGDMLLSQGSDLLRLQCAFIDTPEVINVTNFIGNQRGYPTAFYLPEPQTDGSTGNGAINDFGDRDPLFEEAARLIVMHQQGSTSLIQRKFSIGYNRAGRIVDQLESAGIIGPNEGSKARQVLIDDEYQLENMLSRMK